MKRLFLIASIVVGLASAAAADCTNFKRLPVFNYKKHATGDADFSGIGRMSRNIVFRHSLGTSDAAIYAKRGAATQYTRYGTGAPLPVTVKLSGGRCSTVSNLSYNKKNNARLKTRFRTQFVSPFLAPQNRDQAVALARVILGATYCPNSEIKLNHNYRFVDTEGGKPVVRTRPAVTPWDRGSSDSWNVRFTCSEWRKIN